jgi:hypothetical protein
LKKNFQFAASVLSLAALVSIPLLAGLMILPAKAQNNLDSLKRLLQTTDHLGQRIELYARLAELYLEVDPDSAYDYAVAGLNIADAKTNARVLGRLHHFKGNAEVTRDSLDAAKRSYLLAEKFYAAANDNDGLSVCYLLLGNVEFVQDRLAEALTYYVKGEELAANIRGSGLRGFFYLNIGSIYSKMRSHDEAMRYHLLARDEFKNRSDSFNVAISLAGIAGTFNQLNELDQAESNALQAAAIFRRLNDHAYLSETLLELGGIAEKKNNDSLAWAYFSQTIDEIDQIGIEYAGPRQINRAIALSKLAAYYLQIGNQATAYSNLQEALRLAQQNQQLSIQADATKLLAQYWEQNGRNDSALYYAKAHNDFYHRLLNEENLRALLYQAAAFEFRQQERTSELERLQEQSDKRRNYLILAVVIGLLLIAAVVLIFQVKLGHTRLVKSELEKTSLQNELEFRNKELATHVMHQVRNKEFVLKISEKLRNPELMQNPAYKKVVKEIVSEIEMDSNHDSWKEFEIRFQQVHVDFYKNLGKRFPDLSPNELRLCAFLRLNMSTKDIASVTYQTTNSIDVARHRLRQKMGLGKEENLVAFLSQF